MNPAFGGTSPVSNWQALCGFTKEGASRAARAEGARTPPPTEWIPTPATLPAVQELQELSQSEDWEAALDDDDQSTATIGSLEDEQFAGEEQTLRRSNRNRRQVERYMIDAMMSEILDNTTDAEGAEFE
ncbi:MAG: hypothetical protein ACRCZI_12150, partial [Cetobacterium sp.]